MRKVILFMMVSLDGYFEGANHDISWHNADNDEFTDFVHYQNSQIDTLLFGSTTYEMMAQFWTTAEAAQMDGPKTDFMNNTSKVVFSHSLDKADWKNTKLVKDHSSDAVRQLKEKQGKVIAIFGSNNFATSLIADNLIDEFRIMVNPVALGNGTPLFKGITEKVDLKLVDSREFKSGNVLLTYLPA